MRFFLFNVHLLLLLLLFCLLFLICSQNNEIACLLHSTISHQLIWVYTGLSDDTRLYCIQLFAYKTHSHIIQPYTIHKHRRIAYARIPHSPKTEEEPRNKWKKKWTNITFIREYLSYHRPYAWMPEASMHIFLHSDNVVVNGIRISQRHVIVLVDFSLIPTIWELECMCIQFHWPFSSDAFF